MCGKFTLMLSWREVHDLSDFIGRSQADGDEEMIGTPMRMVPVIHLGENGKRITEPMRWGFADLRSKTPLEKPRHMHARSETIDRLPTFADAFAMRRGIILAKTFNIGEDLPNGKVKQWTITPRNGLPVPIGVIWEKWQNRDGASLLTFCMVTTAANNLIAPKTDRMPAIVPREHWPLWLGENGTAIAAAKAILTPFEGEWDIAEQPAKPKTGKPAKPQAEPLL